jgi:pyridoxal phosphate enzyme (YggS family)
LENILDNIEKIMYNIKDAESRCAGRKKNTETVRLMAVTKTVPAERVNIAIDAGISLLGENRVQEFLSKAELYKLSEIHFIGTLQTNKVKQIVGKVSCIQSVNSEKLLLEIDKCSAKAGVVTDILIEVNIGDEDSKSGISKASVFDLIRLGKELPSLSVRGLMAIPPPFAEEKLYAELEETYERAKSDFGVDTLSVGMSDDYVTAIKYGSNLVRIGSGIFGHRNYTV